MKTRIYAAPAIKGLMNQYVVDTEPRDIDLIDVTLTQAELCWVQPLFGADLVTSYRLRFSSLNRTSDTLG